MRRLSAKSSTFCALHVARGYFLWVQFGKLTNPEQSLKSEGPKSREGPAVPFFGGIVQRSNKIARKGSESQSKPGIKMVYPEPCLKN